MTSEEMKTYLKERRKKLLSQGKCGSCGKRELSTSFRCRECNEKQGWKRIQYERRARRKRGCTKCFSLVMKGKKFCEKHLKMFREASKRYRDRGKEIKIMKTTHKIMGYTLELQEQPKDINGRHHPIYTFTSPDGKVLFQGDDIFLSPFTLQYGAEAAQVVMHWLTLRPGDTDKEYFDKYTEEQMEFAQGDAEEMQVLVIDTIVEDIPNEGWDFISDIQDVLCVKSFCGRIADGFDSFFVLAEEGDYKVIYGMDGIVPFLNKKLVPIFADRL